MTSLSFRYAARSEIGRVRKNNEDAGFASPNLLIVADGMGGHEAGELASSATVATVVSATNDSTTADEVLALLADAVITSGEHIADVVTQNSGLAGMGTTLTALALRGDRIAVAHVGDSRAYILHQGELAQMTKDHTFVQTLVDSGEITKAQAAVHPRRNLMMRAIDGIHAVEVDLSIREAHVGDRFLVCSDGLCGVIEDDAILECLQNADLPSAVTDLIDRAMANGGPDNITVVVAEILEAAIDTDPVLIGAASDTENQDRLPEVDFPSEAEAIIEDELLFVIPKRGIRSWLIPLLATLATLGIAIGSALWWLSGQWYVGVYGQTQVAAVYQGIPSGGLSRIVEVTTLRADFLPEFERNKLQETIASSSREEATALIERLQVRVNDCLQNPTTPGCPALN